MMPLTLAAIGERNTIRKVGGSPEVKKHLENLGFVVGSDVTIINTLGGNVIVGVKGGARGHQPRNGAKDYDIRGILSG